jgi:hypothetical protein
MIGADGLYFGVPRDVLVFKVCGMRSTCSPPEQTIKFQNDFSLLMPQIDDSKPSHRPGGQVVAKITAGHDTTSASLP